MTDILLLGVIHEYQREKELLLNLLQPEQLAAYRKQRGCYQLWVREHVRSFRPELTFDEMDLPETEVENRLLDTGVLWVHMDIPELVRSRFGLSKQRTPDSEWIAEIDEPREDYWLTMIQKMTQVCKLRRIQILCGAAHLDSFGNKLVRSGCTVTARDVRDEAWIDTSWAERRVPTSPPPTAGPRSCE